MAFTLLDILFNRASSIFRAIHRLLEISINYKTDRRVKNDILFSPYVLFQFQVIYIL